MEHPWGTVRHKGARLTKLGIILNQVDTGTILLPEFQRGYVWNRDQVRGLMRSLYQGHPVGSFLIWETEAGTTSTRGSSRAGGVAHLLLDGQQRITSLYGVIRGKAPSFFEGDASTFLNLRFNVENESFEFYAPAKMSDDPLWIDVSELFTKGLEKQFQKLEQKPEIMIKFGTYVGRVARLYGLLDRDFHSETITGTEKTVDIVVDIFNRVNSGGTKLSKGDLALAKICAEWGEARAEMRKELENWASAGFSFSLDWLLRNVNAVTTGRAQFSALEDVSDKEFRRTLRASVKYIGNFLDQVGGRLGLDHDRVLMGRYAVPVVSRLLHLQGGQFADAAQTDRILFWYIHSGLWGRFAGSTETILAQDFDTVEQSGVDGLIRALERWRGGNLAIDAQDFEGSGRGSRFYPLLYLLTRVSGARDFGSGLPLKAQMLGHLTSLQIHHVFPKALLYKHDYLRDEVNAVANFCFLTQQTNLTIGKRAPEEYFAEFESKNPGILESQWIPADPDLWRVEHYRDFLAARRELLAQAANDFLNGLRSGATAEAAPMLGRVTLVTAEPEENEDARGAQVTALLEELASLGFAQPAVDYEIADPETGRPLAVAEAFWSDGLQVGQGAPVVLELDPSVADMTRLSELGCEVFTSVDALRGYAIRRNEVAAGIRGNESDSLNPTPRT